MSPKPAKPRDDRPVDSTDGISADSCAAKPVAQGGARLGAGRPKGQGRWGEATVPLRVPQSQVSTVKSWLAELADLHATMHHTQPLPATDTFLSAGLLPLFPSEINALLPLALYSDRIAAGFPSPADDYVDDRIDLNQHLIRHKEATFFLRVQGDSMLGAGIHDGDLLIVDRALEATDGKVVIAAIDGELTVKRLSIQGKRVRLMPENPAFRPIELQEGQELVIWGVVTNVVHGLV